MRPLCAILLISCVVALSGCSGAPVMTSAQPDQVQGAALHGIVHGGQQPITGASVYLYEVGTGGYGGNGIAASSINASTSLLNSNVLTQTPPGGEDGNNNYYVTTDSNGNFSISNDYTCPSASTQVYLYSVGGNPGAGGVNSAAGLLAGLGSCGSLSSSTFITINEVSTIATAYSLAGFATDATNISSSNTPLAAIDVANAFTTITNLETLKTGVPLTTTLGAYGSVPQSEINTLANILASCINSNGAVTGPANPTACYTLLTSALSGGLTGAQPTDTATAAINIAHNPGANVTALYGLQTATSPFLPDLSPAPNDFSVEIGYGAGPNNYGYFSELEIDGSGNAWVVGGFGTAGDGAGEILASTLGWSATTPMTGGGLSTGSPQRLAIDESENVWLTTAPCAGCASDLVELNSSGATDYTSCSTQIQFADAGFLAVDGSGNVWMPTAFDNVWEYFPGVTCWNWYSGGGLNYPGPIAIDASGNAWMANVNGNSLSEFSSAGMVLSPSGFSGAGEFGPTQIAVDAKGNIWISNYVNGSVSEYNSSGSPLSTSSGYTNSSLTYNGGLAIDGAGNVWVSTGGSNGTPSLIAELNSSGTVISGPTGYTSPDLGSPNLLTVDGSGNLWVLNGGATFIDEFIGLAAPVVTPKAANLAAPYGAYAVNMP